MMPNARQNAHAQGMETAAAAEGAAVQEEGGGEVAREDEGTREEKAA